MRLAVIYVTAARIPGERAHSIQVVRTCEALIRRGAYVLILAPRRRNPLAGVDLASFYGLSVAPKVWLVPCFDLVSRRPSSTSFKLLALSFTLASLPVLLALRAVLRRAVKVVFVREPLIMALMAALKPVHGLPVVYEEHRVPRPSSLYLASLGRCDLIVAISRVQASALRAIAPFLKGRIVVIPDAAEPRLFALQASRDELRRRLGLPVDAKLAMYVGQLSKWKVPEFLVDAASHLRGEAIVVFVGGSQSDVARVREYAERRGVDNVLFLGYKPPSAVPMYMAAADVLIHYSPAELRPGRMESLSPLKLFEYMASGRPILAPDYAPIREVIVDGSTGLLFNPSDPRDLAEKCRLLLRDPELASKLALNAKRALIECFTYSARADRVVSSLLKVLSRAS